MKTFKKILLSGLAVLCVVFASSQDTTQKSERNSIKLNLPALIIRNISVQYERKIGAKTTAALGLRYMPFGKLPYYSTVDKILNDPYTAYVKLNKLNIGTTGVTPQFNYYLGRKGALHGFYIGAFSNYTYYKTNLPIDYNNKTGIFNGSVQTITGGLQLGLQWKLAKKLYMDWWIVGPNYGGSSGKLIFTGSLSPVEQSVMQDELEKLKQQVPFNFIQSYVVGDAGAVINIKGPWAGLRGLGFNLAYQF